MADKKISELDPAAALSGSEEVPIVQTATTVRTTTQDIANLGAGGKITATGNLNFYVATTGSNSNDGLTALTPWQTIQYAANFVAKNYRNPSNHFVTINIAAGTYTEAPIILPWHECGIGGITLEGNTGVAFRNAAVPVIPSAGGLQALVTSCGVWNIDGMVLGEAAPAGFPTFICYATGQGSLISTYRCSFGKNTDGCLGAEFSAICYGDDNEVFGTSGSYLWARSAGVAEHPHDGLTLALDPLFPGGCLHADRYGIIHFNTDGGLSGTSSGPQYNAGEFGRIYTSGTVPGATTGSVAHSAIVAVLDVIIAPTFAGDAGAGGQIGYVPAPAAGDASKFLKGDATWASPTAGAGGNDTEVQYNSTGSLAGDPALLRSGSGQITIGKAAIATGKIVLAGTTSGAVTLSTLDAAGTWTMKLPNSAGTNTYVLTTDGSGNCSWAAPGSGSPGGASGSIQYNNSGAFGGFGSVTTTVLQLTELSGNLLLGVKNTGNYNIALGGFNPGNFATASGSFNVSLGAAAGFALTSGVQNVLIGHASGFALTTTSNNVGVGESTLAASTGSSNVAVGKNALAAATSGSSNVAIGDSAIGSGVATGTGQNVAIGSAALNALTSGTGNLAIGANALLAVTTGSDNIGIGSASVGSCTTTGPNIGIGGNSLAAVAGGSENIGIGHAAGNTITTGGSNTCIGPILSGSGTGASITTGSYNTIIGNVTGLTGALANNVYLADGQGNVVFHHDATDVFIKNSASFAIRLLTTITGGSTANAPTLTTGPANGDPTKWLAVDDNGTTRYIPSW